LVGLKSLCSLAFALSLFATAPVTHASDCGPKDFARLAGDTSQEKIRLLASLREKIATSKLSSISVREENGRTILGIGYIQNDDQALLRLMAAGLRNGFFDEVEWGSIVGPKALNWVERMQSLAGAKSTVKFSGKLNPKDLIETQIEEAEMSILNRVTSSGGPEPLYWGPKEVSDFQQAFEKLKVREACQRLYGTSRL
jgi:hypothetical protein